MAPFIDTTRPNDIGPDQLGKTSMVTTNHLKNQAAPDLARDTTTTEIKPFPPDAIQGLLAKYPRLNVNDIETIYTCTPMQEAILLSQAQGINDYIIRASMAVHPLNGHLVDVHRLQLAWARIVQQSAILRTVFVPSTTGKRLFHQVVLQHVPTGIRMVEMDTPEALFEEAADWENDRVALHRLTFCKTPGNQDYVKVEMHHSVADAHASLKIFHEIMRLYDSPDAELRGPAFREFVEHLQATSEDQKIGYWKEFLDDAQPSLFPQLRVGAHPRSPTTRRNRQLKLDRKRILSLVSTSKVSFSTFFHAAWAVVLRAYLGNDDVVFGYISSGRHNVPLPQISEALGPYISMMINRAKLEDSTSLIDLASELRKNVASNLGYEHCSISRIQQAMQSKTGVFNTLLDVQRRPKLNRASSKLYLDLVHVHTVSDYDLVLNIEDTGTELLARFDYIAGILGETDIDNIAACFSTVVDQFLENPGRRIHEMELSNATHRARLTQWKTKPLSVIRACAHNLIGATAARQPDAEAICSLDISLTYQQMSSISDGLAMHLMSLGVGPGKFIPMCMDKSPWTVITMLAIMKSGAAFVPVDPEAPASRMDDILADTKATVIVASRNTSQSLGNITSSQRVVVVDETFLHTFESAPDCSHLLSDVDCNAAAYVLFTSGSTGKPKGVVVPHEALCCSMYSHGPAMGIESTSRALQFSSYTFDAVIAETLTILLHGGAICVPSDEDRLGNIARPINALRINWAMLTPTFARLLDPDTIPTLRTLVLIGEAVDQESVNSWIGKVRLYNGYGPTETCVVCVASCFSDDLSLSSDIIGKPVGCRGWVVDRNNHNILCPPGVLGELVIEGPNNTAGYLGDPERSAKSFIEPPTWALDLSRQSSQPLFRFYKTGDLVRQLSDGSLRFGGRCDSQVKVRGQRMEPGETEHHALSSDLVVQILVDVPKSGSLKGRLVAVIMLKGLFAPKEPIPLQLILEDQWGAALESLGRLRDKLQSVLPSYMVPTTWIPVQNVPLLSSGKLDRRGIQSWLLNLDGTTVRKLCDLQNMRSMTTSTVEDELSSNDTLRQLRAIWSEALNVPEATIGGQRPFLALGGDSISAMRVVSKARAKGIRIAVKDILRYGTLAAIAPHIQLLDASGVTTTTCRTRANEGSRFALTPIQALHLNAVPSGTNYFNQSFLLQVKSRTEANDIRRAINSLVRQHSMLRARYARDSDGTWWQTITEDEDWRFKVTRSVPSLEAALPLFTVSQRSLDTNKGPVLSVDLIDLDGGTQFLYMVAHHLVIDLVSWRTLFDDLEGALRPQSSMLPSPPSFQEWAVMQREHASGLDAMCSLPYSVPAPQLDYWGMETQPNLYGDTVATTFSLNEKTTSYLLEAANHLLRTEPVELIMGIILHAFHSKFSDRPIPALFTEGHGRQGWSDDVDASRTVGWFTAIYPICIDSDSCTNVMETVRRVKDARRSIPSQGLEYFTSRYLNDAGKQEFKSHEDMEILFNYQGLYQQLERPDSLFRNVSRRSLDFPSDVAADVPRLSLFDIFSGVEEGCFSFTFTWSPRMAHQTGICEWVHDCKILLEQFGQSAASSPMATLSDYPLLSLTYGELDATLRNFMQQSKLENLADIEDVYPCSPSQEGMIVSQMRQPERSLYNFETTWKVSSLGEAAPDLDRLEAACATVIMRHQILRTVFCQTDQEDTPFVQIVVKDPSTLGLPLSRSISSPQNLIITPSAILDSSRFPYHLALGEWEDGVYCKFVINHCLLDGSCLGLLIQDIYSAYENIQLPDAPLYSSFIDHLLTTPSESAYSYWETHLAGVSRCHFPALNAAKDTTPTFDRVDVMFTGDQVDGIRILCRDQGVTVSTVMSAAWAMVLKAYMGNEAETVCFGYMASGRDVPVDGVDELLGPLLNMLVQRVDLPSSLTIANVLRQVHESVLASLPHQHCSLAKIHKSLGMKGETLFNTLVNVQRRESIGEAKPGQQIQMAITDYNDPAEFDIILNVNDTTEDITANIHFWTSCIDHGHAENIRATLLSILDSMIRATRTFIRDIELVAEHHHQQIMKWNPAIPHTVTACLHHLFEAQVARRPDAPAVSTTGSEGNWSYASLDDMVTRLAARLSNLGVGPEIAVPFCFDKSPWAVVAMLAILKAGGACVSLDPTYPVSRLRDIISMTKATVIICQDRHIEKFEGDFNLSIVSLTPKLWTALESRTIVSTPVKPNNAAFVNFTSGSTGVPKASILEHRSLCSAMWHHHQIDQMGDATRALHFSSYTFDMSFAEILFTLCSGGCLCVPSEDERMNNLAATIRALNVNWAYLTPTVAGLLEPDVVPSLKTICLGGEPVLDGLVAKLLRHVRLIATYGPSECSVAISRSEVKGFGNGQLGPASGALLWVVDADNHNRLVPIGSPGELLIEGPLVGRGYILKEHNDAAFVQDPSWTETLRVPEDSPSGSGRRMYKTGDIVRFQNDGSMVMVGRKDTQAKIHGQRVDLGEVEHHLIEASETVHHVACLVPKKGHLAGRLTAILSSMELADTAMGAVANDIQVLGGKHVNAQVQRLRAHLEDAVPAFMIPRAWAMTKTVPVTLNGKLNRRALLQWLENVDESIYEAILAAETTNKQSYEMNEMERILALAFSRVLNLPETQIGLNQSFFSLGGDSISAIQVSSRLRGQGIRLSMQHVMQHRTIADIAKHAEYIKALVTEIPAESLETTFPLTPIQRFHFAHMTQERNHYNQGFFLRIKKSTDGDTLLRALQAVLSWHSMLRARFSQDEQGQWSQYILSDADASSLQFQVTSGIESLEEAQDTLQAAQEGLDFRNGPVVGASLLLLNNGSQYLHVTAHHLIVDLVSWRIILEDLEEVLCTGNIKSHPTMSFQAWSGLQLAYSRSDSGHAALAPPSVLPSETCPADFDYWGVSDARSYGTTIWSSFELDPSATTALIANANDALGTKPVDIFMAAILTAFITTFPGRRIPSIYTEGHGREPWDAEIDISRTVGWFTTMYPITIPKESSSSDFLHTLRLVKDMSRATPANGWRYFTSRYLTAAGRTAFAAHDNMEILYNHLGQYQQLERDDGYFEKATLPYDLPEFGPSTPRSAIFEIASVIENNRLVFRFGYSSELGRQSSIANWARECHSCLADAAEKLPSLHERLPTFSDFPLLRNRLSYGDLEKLFQGLNLPISDIEDIYPCSPMQEGILLSRARQEGLYDTVDTWKLYPRANILPVDVKQVESAISLVIVRHQALRTVFLPCEGATPYVQAVLRRVTPPVIYITARTADEFLYTRPSPSSSPDGIDLGYRFTICATDVGEVCCRLEINHALIDGPSMEVLMGDLLKAYEGALATASRPPLYSDFISYLESHPVDAALEYWTERVKDLAPCRLPSIDAAEDEPPAFMSTQCKLDVNLTNRMQEFCRLHSTTTASIMSVVWSLVLRAYTGNETVCFGYLSSGRAVAVPQVESVIGPLITMMISRVDLDDKTPVLELLGNVGKNFVDGLAHQHCPLSRIQHAASEEGQKGPLFNTVVNVQKRDFSKQSLSTSVAVEILDVHDPSEYDVTLNIEHNEQEINISLVHWSTCLSTAHAQLMQETIIQTLSSLLDNPSGTVRDVNMFSEAHKARLLEWAPVMPPATLSCVHDMVDRAVKLHPEKEALCTSHLSMTYQELNCLSSHLAAHLAFLGVGPEIMVPFCFDKSPWAVVTMYAILKAGGACVVLSPDYPDLRLASIINSTKASVAVSDEKYASRLGGLVRKVVALDGSKQTVASMIDYLQALPGAPVTSASPDNVAFVAFTSGSTGTPKGILLEHRSISTSIRSQTLSQLMSRDRRVLQFSSYTFDVSIGEIFTTLTHGATVCIPSEYERMNELGEFMSGQRVDFAYLTPTVAGLLNPDAVKLDTLVLLGELVPQSQMQRWTPATKVVPSYGPAECSILCSGTIVDSAHPPDGLIGKPAGSLLWVADSKDPNRLAPLGCSGELLIEGPLLARGYINAKQTEEAFIVDPEWTRSVGVLGAGATRRLYRTGDIVRYGLDGSLVYLGRNDAQVKIHGQRLDLGEIEHHISRRCMTSAAALVPKKGHWKNALVVAFPLENGHHQYSQEMEVVVTDAASSRVNQLRGALQSHVPEYMVPRAWIPVTGLPVTSNGKMNRRAIQTFIETLSVETCGHLITLGRASDPAHPLSDLEKQFVSVWSKVLSISEATVDITQPFFRLGGDSIAAMHAASQLRSLGIRVAVHDILRYRSIDALAALVAQRQDSDAPAVQTSLRLSESNGDDFPLTPIQAFHFQTNPGGVNHFNQSSLVRLRRAFDADAVRDALVALVDRHPMLRTRFSIDSSGIWSQAIVGEASQSLRFSTCTFGSMDAARTSFTLDQTSLNIQEGPLMAASLVSIDGGAGTDQILYMVIHHLVVDLVSWQILLQDLEESLLHRPLSPQPLSFQAWSIAQDDYASRNLYPANVLHGELPPLVKDPGYWQMGDTPNIYALAKRSAFTVDTETTAVLLGHANDALQTEGIEILTAILILSFGQIFQDRELPVVFCEGHGRETALDWDLSQIVGWFTTIFPLWASSVDRHCPIERQVVEILRSVKDCRRRLPGKGWSYFASRYLHEQGRSEYQGHGNMEILFNYLGSTRLSATRDSLFEPLAVGDVSHVDMQATRSALFDITASLEDGQLRFQFEYPEGTARVSQVETWINQCQDLVIAAADALCQLPSTPTLADYPLLAIDDYVALDDLIQYCVSHLGLSSASEIQSIYPCAPMQEGILLSRSRSADVYNVQAIWKASDLSRAQRIDVQHLRTACARVISRHDMLRTHIVEFHHQQSGFLQVVLESVTPPVQVVQLASLRELENQSPDRILVGGNLPYLITLCQVPEGDVYLRLDINHALTDGTSTRLLVQDIVRAYHDDLPVIGPGYSDFISHLSTIRKEEALAFWTESLQNATPCNFPHLVPHAYVEKSIFSAIEVDLSPSSSQELHDFCKKHSITLANFMSVVWGLVLSCYVGTDSPNVTFGYLSSGRDVPIADVNNIFGPLITMIVRKAELRPDVTVLEMLDRMQNDFTASWPYQHCSLSDIHHALGLKGNPLFNTIINVQRVASLHEPAKYNIAFEPQMGHDPSEYDISFNVVDGKSISLSLGYWDRCLSEAQAAVVSRTVRAVISSVLAHPDQPVSSVSFVEDRDFEIMARWNSAVPTPVNQCIQDSIETNAGLYPDAPAVCSTDPEVRLTYKQFNNFADKLATQLILLGIGPESLVPFCFDKSPWTSIAMVAILKAGGACVALDPTQPSKRLEGIIRDSCARVILAAPQHSSRFNTTVPHVLSVDQHTLQELPPLADEALARGRANPNHPAFVIFTSGSTGTPKGIVVEHGAFCSSARSHAPMLRMQRGSRVLQFASHTYDLSIAETFTTLMVGGCICVPSEYDRLNRLAAAINTMQVDWMFLTPTVAALVTPEKVPTVRTLVLGGEHATQNNFASWGGRPDVCLINSYGPAECAIWTNANIGVGVAADTSNIGPRIGCSLWIVDAGDHGRLMPVGARGELLIGGPTLARGYLHNPTQTDAAFIQPPAWSARWEELGDGQRFYKSGDLARYNLDGTLSIQGRKDTQIKIHGHRIELGDIEGNLVGVSTVEHAVVQFPRSGILARRLVAVISLKGLPDQVVQPAALQLIQEPDQRQTAVQMLDTIRSELEQRLPKHMIPTLWIVVERLPLLSSGKLDKRATQAWLNSLDEETCAHVQALSNSVSRPASSSPTTPIESILHQLWAEVLKCPPSDIPMDLSFLRLGGDSISAMHVVSRARARNINIFVQDILRLGTIRSLAQQANAAGPITKPSNHQARFSLLGSKGDQLDGFIEDCVSRLDLRASHDVEDIFPCSPMQEGILISQARAHDNYRVRALFKVLVDSNQPVDMDRLAHAWAQVAARHQAMRSVLLQDTTGDANFFQVVLKRSFVPVRIEKCDTVAQFQQLPDVNDYADQGPPYSVSLFKVTSGEVYCQLVISHALDDGSSMQVLTRDVCLAYDDLLPSGPPPLYSNFISYLQNQPAEANLAFWKTYLDGVVSTHFPVLRTTPTPSRQTLMLDDKIQGHDADAVHKLCETHDITVADIIRTVWALVLATYTGTESVCFGFLASGRDAPVEDVHNIVGPLINMLVFRADIAPSMKLVDILHGAHERYVQSLSHQHCSLKDISHGIGAGQTALFNTLVNVQRATSAFFAHENDSSQQPTIILRNVDLHDPTEYDLSLDVMESKAEIHIMLHYWTDIIEAEHATSILSLITSLIKQIATEPLQSVQELQLFGQTDLEFMDRCSLATSPIADRCIHEVIQAQVATKPVDSIAIESDAGSLTYRELDDLTNNLAHLLVERGAGPEVIVPCCFEKSPWAIVAMLAVLKSGATCVAIDPDYPSERKRMIVEDTGATFVLTSPAQATSITDIQVPAVLISPEYLHAMVSLERPGPRTTVTPSNAAFIVYTSGSTGTPKGAVLEHRNLYAACRGLERLLMTSESRVSHFASYAFDVSIEETVLALARGACVCIIPDKDRLGDLAGALNRLKVNWLDLTPTVLRMLDADDLPHLKTIVLGGELLPDDIAAKWHDRVNLFNAYGPCECTISATATDPLKPGDRGSVIGRPLESRLWIVDADNDRGRLLPVGAVGELCIEGALVSRGYLNNPEKTDESFIDAALWPVGQDDGRSPRRAYKTGDLARWNADGTMSYLGRKDSQVKIHGQRLELGEVEHQVLACAGPRMKSAIAAVPKQGYLSQRLVLFFVPDTAQQSPAAPSRQPPLIQDTALVSGALNEAAQTRDDLKARLPRHMIPSLWLPVFAIPTMPSGKANRRLLQQWLETADQQTYAGLLSTTHKLTTVISPATVMEEDLRNIWSALLSQPANSISMDQNFFASGGDSVLAIRFISRCRAQGIVASLRDLFHYGTISALAPHCTRVTQEPLDATIKSSPPSSPRGLEQTAQEAGLLSIDLSTVEDIYPCSPMQNSILAIQNKQKNAWYASWIMELRVSASLALEDVARCWQQVVDRHAILRTTFQFSSIKPDTFYQVVLKSFSAPVSYVSQTASLDPFSPFNASPDMPDSNTPPHRLVLAGASSGAVLLQLQLSHTLYDAVSLSILWNDLEAACAGSLHEVPAAPKYRTFIDYLSGIDKGKTLSFWKKHLANTRPCHLRFPAQTATPTPSAGSFVSTVVPFTKTSQARAFCHAHAITSANLFQAAWALALRHLTGSDDVCFGFMLSGRDAPISNVDDISGPCVNLLPYRVRLARGETRFSLSTLLHGIQSDLAMVLMNQNCSTGEIQDALAPQNSHIEHAPYAPSLFNTFLNMQHVAKQPPHPQPGTQQARPVVKLTELSGYMTDEYAVSVYVIDDQDAGGEISVSFCYWTSLVPNDAVDLVSGALVQALDALLQSGLDDDVPMY
ncbi:uncharacterized protein BDV14DRAFT_198344 [Aspergillus stella-maris]|uniref:uncharacterized protein n=1 Tax=Aspergillus stella-maris TaxID=1810926 RepID=UPI003CCCBA2B